MKNNNLTLCLSAALLLGALCSISAISNKVENDLFLETTAQSESFESGKAITLNNRGAVDPNATVSEVKAQVSDVDENGNRSIRFVAAISSLDVNASFVRTMYNEDGSVDLSEKELVSTMAFTSIEADGEIILPSSFGEDYNYFIAYTLQNVPGEAWYNRLDVQVKVNELVEEKAANVEGLLPYDNRLEYTKISDGKYKVSAASEIDGEVIVPEECKLVEGTVATRLGKVTAVADGGFDGERSMTKISLPSTITTFGAQAFRNCSKLTSINLPYSLTSVGSLAFYGLAELDTVYYESSNLRTTSSGFDPNPNKLYISNDVTYVPSSLFGDDVIDLVEYDGSKEEFNEKVTLGSTTSGLANSAIKCDDSVEYTATFIFEGAKLTIGETIYENKYEFKNWEGAKLVNPGSPEKDGAKFDGWYLDEAGTEAATFNYATKLNSNINFYAKFLESVPGMTVDNPIVLNDGYRASATTSSAMPYVYYSFTPTKTDYYYFGNYDSSMDTKVWIYKGAQDTTELAYNDDGFGVSNRPLLGYKLEKDTTYTYKVGYYNGSKFGNMDIGFFTKVGDMIEESVSINMNEEISGEAVLGTSNYYTFASGENTSISIEPFAVGTANKLFAKLTLLNSAGSEIGSHSFKKTGSTAFECAVNPGENYTLCVSYLFGTTASKPNNNLMTGGNSFTFTIEGSVVVEEDNSGLINAPLNSSFVVGGSYQTISLTNGKAYFKVQGIYFTDVFFKGFTGKINVKIYDVQGSAEPKTAIVDKDVYSGGYASLTVYTSHYYYFEITGEVESVQVQLYEESYDW